MNSESLSRRLAVRLVLLATLFSAQWAMVTGADQEVPDANARTEAEMKHYSEPLEYTG